MRGEKLLIENKGGGGLSEEEVRRVCTRGREGLSGAEIPAKILTAPIRQIRTQCSFCVLS